MKQIQFYLQKKGVSMVDGGVISTPEDFIYKYDENLSVKSLVHLCQRIYEDIKKKMAEKNTTEVTAVFGYLTIRDSVAMFNFIAGWLNIHGEVEGISAYIPREKLVRTPK